MKKQTSHLLKAIIATIIACCIVFALALYIFGTQGFRISRIGESPTISPSQTGVVMIKVPLDMTGSETPISLDTDTGARACTLEYAPVCGVDGKTYGNTCMAGDISIAHTGGCIDTSSGILFDTGSYHLYSNKGIGYSFAMPKYSYYSSAGTHDGANHTMAIALTASGVLDFSLASVQVWFYRKIPATPPSSQSVQTANGTLYIRNNDTTASAKIGKIVDTVLQSAK